MDGQLELLSPRQQRLPGRALAQVPSYMYESPVSNDKTVYFIEFETDANCFLLGRGF